MASAILVACPNQSSKEYAFAQWIAAVKALTYPNLEVLVVDNSHRLDFYNRWKTKVPMVRLDPGEPGQMHANRRIALSMELIRGHYLRNDFQWWLNIESDVIVPPDTIEIMLAQSEGIDMLCAPYPVRDRQSDWNTNSFGCTLFSRRLMGEMSFRDAPENPTTDRWIHNEIIAPAGGRFKVHNLPVGILGIRHLQDPDPASIGWEWW